MIKIPPSVDSEEEQYLEAAIKLLGASPRLEAIWALMDLAWWKIGCNERSIDPEKLKMFYSHPVWLLNGLFVEQHTESLEHRRIFSEYVASLKPSRLADFGGGYGTLARMIGQYCPDTQIDIVEPHPHPAAIALANQTQNVSYVADFQGEYDMIIATDVFEHVPDPLALLEQTSKHLKLQGHYLIANNFWPVIKCHLPATFHFRWSWDAVMKRMNLKPGMVVSYGRSYLKVDSVLSQPARNLEKRSVRWFELIERLPPRRKKILVRLLLG